MFYEYFSIPVKHILQFINKQNKIIKQKNNYLMEKNFNEYVNKSNFFLYSKIKIEK